MADVVVTVPMSFWADWIKEGDAAGDPPTGEEWGFSVYGRKPAIDPGQRVYIVAHGRLRGYAPLTRLVRDGRHWMLCRRGRAVAVTIPQEVKGFRGFKYRWWHRSLEFPFPHWKTEGVRAASPRSAQVEKRRRRRGGDKQL